LLDAKRQGRPVPPYALGVENTGGLDELCMQMMEREAHQRPTVAAALAALAGALTANDQSELGERGKLVPRLDSAPPTLTATAAMSLRPQVAHKPDRRASFAGREKELAWVDAELSRAREGERRLLIVEAESGMGKTALVAEWLRQLEQRDPTAIVLHSRCYANEQIAYQAFDAAFDDLARVLLPREECEAKLPAKVAVLVDLFPVLGSVASIGEASRKGVPAEPSARRSLALEVLLDLLVGLSAELPLVIAIDDLQWADAESFRLLDALTRRDARRHPLVLATQRPTDACDEATVTMLRCVGDGFRHCPWGSNLPPLRGGRSLHPIYLPGAFPRPEHGHSRLHESPTLCACCGSCRARCICAPFTNGSAPCRRGTYEKCRPRVGLAR